MIKNLKYSALLALALMVPLQQSAPLFAMPKSTKIILGATAVSIGATFIYGYVIYKKEAQAAGHKAGFNNYRKHLGQLLTNKHARSVMHQTHPEFTAFVAANSALLALSTGKLVTDRYFTAAPIVPPATPVDPKLLPPTKPLNELTNKERGDRKEAQRKAKGEEALDQKTKGVVTYYVDPVTGKEDPTKETLNLDFKRADAGWTDEEIKAGNERYAQFKGAVNEANAEKDPLKRAARLKLLLENDAQWLDRMNQEADDADLMPVPKVTAHDVTKKDIADFTDRTVAELEKDLAILVAELQPDEIKKELEKLQLGVFENSAKFKEAKEAVDQYNAAYEAKSEAYKAARDEERAKKPAKTKEEIFAIKKRDALVRTNAIIKKETANAKANAFDNFYAHEIYDYLQEKEVAEGDMYLPRGINPKFADEFDRNNRNAKVKKIIQNHRRKLKDEGKLHDAYDVPVEVLEPKAKAKKA